MFPLDLQRHVVLDELDFFALLPGLERVQPLLVIRAVVLIQARAFVEVLLPSFKCHLLVLV